MKTKLTAMVLAAIATSAAIPALADTWTDPDTGITWSYYYTYSTRPVLEIANYDIHGNVSVAVTPLPRGALTIPSKINGDYVESIGYYAFQGCEDLTSVTIPASVLYVDSGAFSGCRQLKSVVFQGGGAQIAESFPKSCRFFVGRESTGWGVSIPGMWNGHEIRYVEDFLPPQPSGGSLRPGVWYGTDVSVCHVADYLDVMQRADAENKPFVVVFGHKGCSYCRLYLQKDIDPTIALPTDAFLYNAYFANKEDQISDLNYQAAQNSITAMPWNCSWPLIYLRWRKADGTLMERVRYYGEEVNGEKTYPKTTGDLLTYVEEMRDDVSCYVQFYHNDGEYSTLTLSLVKPNSVIGGLPVPSRDGYDFEGWFTSFEGGNRVLPTYLVRNDMILYAHWRHVGSADVRMEDDWLSVEGIDKTFNVGEAINGYRNLQDFFSVDSGSPPVVKVSGLPTGVKYDTRTQTFSGAPTKSGVYYVTCSAKNKNGYSHSLISVWNVGNASNGDYDEIGIDWEVLENFETYSPIEWRTGEKVGFSLLYAFDNDDLYPASVSGLPPTLSVPKCPANAACGYPPGTYYGTLTKAGKYKVTVTAKPWGGNMQRKAVKTIIVQDSGCRYLKVVSTNTSRGTATGSKVYAIGAKASISAKAASGYYFAGWYRDAEFQEPLENTASGDWRKASDSVVVTADLAETGIYARYVTAGEDPVSIVCDDTWEVDTGWSDSFHVDVHSKTLPTVTVKGLPSGVTWNKSRFMLESTPSKLKPGTAVATITVKNLAGRTATMDVRIGVPNIESYVFSGLDYSSDAYSLTLGVSDACVMGWFSFDYDTDYKVTASGLPPGLKLATDADGTAYIVGTPTKAGTYMVTLTAKRGTVAEKATVTITVDPLPEYAVGTFNGVLRDETSGEIVGSFTFTAAATGKQSVKVVTKLGTMSLSSPAWNCYYDESRPMAYFSKYSKNEDFSFMLTPQYDASWNCEHQLEGSLMWRKSSAVGESSIEAAIDIAQRNPFGKTGTAYDHPVAANVAESLASEYRSMKTVILWDSDLNAYKLECADCVVPGYDDGTATLKMNKNGTATISGKLYNLYSFTATSTLTFDTSCGDYGSYLFGEHCHAVFTPVVKMKVCAHAISGDKCFTENELVPIHWRPLDE